MSYEYSVENMQDSWGRDIVVETLYPLSVGMHVWIPLRNSKLMKVEKIFMYNDAAVIVVAED